MQESYSIALHLFLVKQFKIGSSDIFQILVHFQSIDVYYIKRYLTVWSITIVSQQVPLFKRVLYILIRLLIPA